MKGHNDPLKFRGSFIFGHKSKTEIAECNFSLLDSYGLKVSVGRACCLTASDTFIICIINAVKTLIIKLLDYIPHSSEHIDNGSILKDSMCIEALTEVLILLFK